MFLLVLCGAAGAEPSKLPEDNYYDIGSIHHKVSTASPSAQRWFDRGLAMCFGFNHEEAVRCFERALADDPAMPMAWWGMAYAWGPNINNMLIEPTQMGQAALAIRMARLYAKRASPRHRALIGALAQRCALPVPKDRGPLNQAYADAMRAVYREHATDPLVAMLFAESLMNLQPWKHWDHDGRPGPHTGEIVAVLEAALERHPDYPGLCHFYIHTMEASPLVEKALPAADRLRGAAPGLGHLVHMPTHIDVRLGDYRQVVEANQQAIAADADFLKREGANNFFTYYRIHNYHFLVYGAMFDGQSAIALKAARDLTQQVPAEMLREQVDFLDAFMPTPLHVLVRFGRWEDILAEPEPAEFLPVSRSVWHYARALAYAATGRIDQAEAEQQSFLEVRETVPETSFLFQNASQELLGVAEAMIAGEIAYRQGKHQRAFRHLREAVRRRDALNYDEPWGWMQPARHALGALLLEQGRFDQAETVYREDLKRHPRNPWALHGLAESLAEQGKTEQAESYAAQFQAATQRADVAIDRSCYCRIADRPADKQ